MLLRLQDRLQVRIWQGKGHRLQKGMQRIFNHQGLYEQEANSIEILKGQLTSLLKFTLLKNSDL